MTTNNHPANGPVSIERLHQISEILSKAAAQSDGGNLGYAMADAVKVIDGAIAAFGAEPVGTFRKGPCGYYPSFHEDAVQLYTAPPAQLVNTIDETLIEALRLAQCMLDDYRERNYGHAQEWIRHISAKMDDYSEQHGDDAYSVISAAMLQAEPASNSDELPLDYLQGHKDGLEWAAQLAEANHPQTGDWLYDDPIELARAIRKGPDMPEFKSAFADEDDNFYSWFGRFWLENYQQNNYTTSAKQMLGTIAEFAYRAGRESANQAGNSPVTPDDVRRMDWLVSKTVDVREPMVYGSHSLFWSQTITDEDDDYHATKLREQIDAAMAAEQAAPQHEVNK